MDVEFGNVDQLDTQQSGWFIGFSDWTKTDSQSNVNLRHVPLDSDLSNVCVKWMHHKPGDTRGLSKPISTGRTVSILVSDTGGFRLAFSPTPTFYDATRIDFVLRQRGDFVIWGENVFHQAIVDKDSTILTIRWT